MENQSEIKFVKWSNKIRPDDPDVRYVADALHALNEPALHGLDVGGGIGRFASFVCQSVDGCTMDVVDSSRLAARNFIDDDPCLTLIQEDFFDMDEGRKYDFLILKTVLHHFVGPSARKTAQLQARGLQKARKLLKEGGVLLIEENFYESLFGSDLTGRLIYFLTHLTTFARLFRKLGANTAGEGVRFRSFRSWKAMLARNGLEINSVDCPGTWGRNMPLWKKLPLLCVRRYQATLNVTAREPGK